MRLKRPDFAKGNTEAAGIILAAPGLYGAGLAEWARRWAAAHPPKVRRWERPAATAQEGAQMALFSDSSQQAEAAQ
jgi:hypothetical protein